MIKNSAIKKIIISTLALILVSVLYLFPNSSKKKLISKEISFNTPLKTIIYIPNNTNYVSRIEIVTKEKELINNIKEIIAYLTIDSEKKDYIPIFFYPIIPKDTKIIDLDLSKNILKINFSKEFMNIEAGKERHLIEAIVYTLTEFKDIDKVMIFVEGNILNKIPNTNEIIPSELDRSMGINIIYDISDYKNTSLTTTYYISKQNEYYYYIPVSKINNNNSEKIEIIIEELKSMPIYQTNLMSFLKSNVKLLDYEILENQINLSFNNYLLDDIKKKNILEEVKYSIALSIKDNYNIKTVTYNVDNQEILKFTLN